MPTITHNDILVFLQSRSNYLSKETLKHFQANCQDIDGDVLLRFEILDLRSQFKCTYAESLRLWKDLVAIGWVYEERKENVWSDCVKDNFRGMFTGCVDNYAMKDSWLRLYNEQDASDIFGKDDGEIIYNGIRSVEHVLKRKRRGERDWLPDSKRRKLSKIGLPYVQIVEIQNRDLSPNDYSVLTSLDQHVKKKGTDPEVLKEIPKVQYASLEKKTSCGCMICLDNFTKVTTVSKLRCGHLFHPACLENWLKESQCCPLCKQKVHPKYEDQVVNISQSSSSSSDDSLEEMDDEDSHPSEEQAEPVSPVKGTTTDATTSRTTLQGGASIPLEKAQ